MSGRDLGQVFHYFIPEEEQAAARARAEPSPAARSGAWCLVLEPRRPVVCALGLELAATLGEAERPARVLASFDAPPLLPRSSAVVWERVAARELRASLTRELGAEPSGWQLVVLRPAELGGVLPQLPPGSVCGVILLVDGALWGLPHALAALRRLPDTPGATIEVVVVGAGGRTAAERLFRRLARAAERQLGLQLRLLGCVDPDPSSYRSLLSGHSVLDLDRESQSARDLRALGGQLLSSAATVPS